MLARTTGLGNNGNLERFNLNFKSPAAHLGPMHINGHKQTTFKLAESENSASFRNAADAEDKLGRPKQPMATTIPEAKTYSSGGSRRAAHERQTLRPPRRGVYHSSWPTAAVIDTKLRRHRRVILSHSHGDATNEETTRKQKKILIHPRAHWSDMPYPHRIARVVYLNADSPQKGKRLKSQIKWTGRDFWSKAIISSRRLQYYAAVIINRFEVANAERGQSLFRSWVIICNLYPLRACSIYRWNLMHTHKRKQRA